MQYALPSSLNEALNLRGAGDWQVIAGGTDVYPAAVGVSIRSNLLDISQVQGLGGIQATETVWRIGALTTWTQLLQADLPAAFTGLKHAARELGSIQIQNVASIAGNLCNASPAADGVPALLVLDAQVELHSARGKRELALADFVLGNRRTALRPDEIMTAILIPRKYEHVPTHFVKLGARKYLVISIAMVAAQIVLDDEHCISDARIAVGSCSAVACRLLTLEQSLIGLAVTPGLGVSIGPDHLPELIPIDDIRGSADYRLKAAATLVRRAVDTCLARSL